MKLKLTPQENKSGDPTLATQGFGKVSFDHPVFDPVTERQQAADFFSEQGFVVLANCLSADELGHLNEFFDRTQALHPDRWGLATKRKPHHRNQGLIYSQPLLEYPELDQYTRHPASFPLVEQLLGGKGRPRFAEFNLRETPEGAGKGQMNFHHDRVSEDRFLREPYMPCDWLCAIHYLTETNRHTPAFCVVPRSRHYETLKEAYEKLGNEYVEVPIYGPAGTCVLYDTATHHTRFDGDGKSRRRTWHQYYGRGGWLKSALPTTDRYMRAPSPVLTDWNLFPQRLAMSDDADTRLFFSHWNTAQGEWAASGFSDEVRTTMPRGEQ